MVVLFFIFFNFYFLQHSKTTKKLGNIFYIFTCNADFGKKNANVYNVFWQFLIFFELSENYSKILPD